MKKPLHPISWFRQLQRRRPAMAGLVYLAAAVLLLTLLYAVGVIPGSHAQTQPSASSPTPTATTGRERRPPRHNTALDTTGPWQNASVDLAKNDEKRMNDELNTSLGIDNATLSDYVAIQAQSGNSDYNIAENRLTDLIKQVTARPSTTYQGVSDECDRLNAAYDAWQTTAWSTANQTLDGQVVDMNTQSGAARAFLKAHPEYPHPCAVYASGDIAKSAGDTREDFFATVGRISASNSWLDKCTDSMSDAQSAAMPQDQYASTPGGQS